MRKFVFDVDGTLTPSRGKIDPQFEAWFSSFIEREKVFLVTGSDYPKTAEQLGNEICESVVTVYNCQGNDVWFKGKRVNSKEFTPPKELDEIMQGWLEASPFPYRTGNHIEHRRGLINFSVVGRNANPEQRKEYYEYDCKFRERESIAFQINSAFENVTATVGGETGIDIHRTGADKSQILEDFNQDDEIHFFGDRIDEGGNDYPLAKANKRGKNYHVKDWKETWEILKGFN
jgi:phosphomannomutase